MKAYRGVRRRIRYSIAKRFIDHPDGWDYWWEESKKPNAKAQRAELMAKLRDPHCYANEDGSPDTASFRLCKMTLEILD